VTQEPLGVLGLATDISVSAKFTRPLIVHAARDIERLLEDQVFGRERELLEHYLRNRAGRPTPFLTVDRAGHTVIQNARMLQSASGEDVQLLLSVARHALSDESDIVEELELSRGRSHAAVRLVHAGDEVLGALVSVERIARARHDAGCQLSLDWAPLVGRSPAMQRLFREATKVAEQRMTVAIHGEPGTGKLSLAQLLHRFGGEGPVTLVHCARDGWEQEWSDAVHAGGTIVLRRVHGLSRDAQLQLCDQLDELESDHPGVWVISLLNSDFEPPCAELISRLARVSLIVPALRDRGYDLRLLIDDWFDTRERLTGTRPVLRPETYEALAAQSWPGNIRELHNALDAATLRGGTVIGVESLQLDVRAHHGGGSSTGSLRAIEREAINAALERSGGNVTRAAKELGIGRATLHRRLRAYRLLSPHGAEA
jgi:transcriptional regulator of acetoin/glycerol metabolism